MCNHSYSMAFAPRHLPGCLCFVRLYCWWNWTISIIPRSRGGMLGRTAQELHYVCLDTSHHLLGHWNSRIFHVQFEKEPASPQENWDEEKPDEIGITWNRNVLKQMGRPDKRYARWLLLLGSPSDGQKDAYHILYRIFGLSCWRSPDPCNNARRGCKHHECCVFEAIWLRYWKCFQYL